jgi:hypothetical protein
MKDLAESDFEIATQDLGDCSVEFIQAIHRMRLKKECSDGKIKIGMELKLR